MVAHNGRLKMDYQAEIASLVARLDAMQANERRLIDKLAASEKEQRVAAAERAAEEKAAEKAEEAAAAAEKAAAEKATAEKVVAEKALAMRAAEDKAAMKRAAAV
jgi:colicin import membrane protein